MDQQKTALTNSLEVKITTSRNHDSYEMVMNHYYLTDMFIVLTEYVPAS